MGGEERKTGDEIITTCQDNIKEADTIAFVAKRHEIAKIWVKLVVVKETFSKKGRCARK